MIAVRTPCLAMDLQKTYPLKPSIDRWALDCKPSSLHHSTRGSPSHDVSSFSRSRLYRQALVSWPLRVQVSRCPKDVLCILPICDGDVAGTTAAHRTLAAVGCRRLFGKDCCTDTGPTSGCGPGTTKHTTPPPIVLPHCHTWYCAPVSGQSRQMGISWYPPATLCATAACIVSIRNCIRGHEVESSTIIESCLSARRCWYRKF